MPKSVGVVSLSSTAVSSSVLISSMSSWHRLARSLRKIIAMKTGVGGWSSPGGRLAASVSVRLARAGTAGSVRIARGSTPCSVRLTGAGTAGSVRIARGSTPCPVRLAGAETDGSVRISWGRSPG